VSGQSKSSDDRRLVRLRKCKTAGAPEPSHGPALEQIRADDPHMNGPP